MVIETACRVDAALLLVAAITYDAIISDFRMPGMNGLSLLQEVVRLRPETSLIMVTAHGDNHLEEQAVRLGAYAFVHKPIDREQVASIVQRALQRATLLKRIRQEELQSQSDYLGITPLAGPGLAALQRAREFSTELQEKITELVKPPDDPPQS
jgi:DNA-binding NtrC family response regulator